MYNHLFAWKLPKFGLSKCIVFFDTRSYPESLHLSRLPWMQLRARYHSCIVMAYLCIMLHDETLKSKCMESKKRTRLDARPWSQCRVTVAIGSFRKQISGSECPTRSGAHAIAEHLSVQGFDKMYRSGYTSYHSGVAGSKMHTGRVRR